MAADTEKRALLANDLRALVSQLNEKLKLASEQGLTTHTNVSSGLWLVAGARRVEEVSIRILAEVE